MIGYLPQFQDNETLYSYLANLYMKSGYLSARQFMKDIFARSGAIDKDFYNQFNKEFFKELCETHDWKDIVLNHTCFKYFTRFISNKQRKAAWKEAMNNGNRLRRYVILPRNYNSYNERKLKYCPCCLLDQQVPCYSISHQYKEATVCPVCGCYLRETTVRSDSAHLGVFHPAVDECVSERLKTTKETDINYLLSVYIDKVNKCELILDCKCTIGEYLNYKLKDTKYLKGIRGGKKDIQGLYQDIMEYYKDLSINPITPAHLKFHFEDKMVNPYEICMIGMFLGIKPSELASYGKKRIEPLWKKTDETIKRLYKQGMRPYQIADVLCCPRQTIAKVISKINKPLNKGGNNNGR